MLTPLCTTVVTEAAELQRLRPAWDELYTSCPRATPFVSYGWLSAWWASFGQTNSALVTVTRNGQLVAIAPFYVFRDARGLRHLRLMGHGHSDYPDLLISADDESDSMAAIWCTLSGMSWHVATFSDLRPESPLLVNLTASDVSTHVAPSGVAPCLSLPTDFRAFKDGLPQSLRRTLRRCRTRLEQRGTISSEQVSPAESEAMLEVLFRLHTDQWQHLNQPGVFGESRVREFHRRVLRVLGHDGTVRLWAIRCNGDIVGVKYTLWRNGYVWSYISGIAHAYRAFSLGALFFEDVIGHAIAERCTHFDFLRGAEGYKYVWGASDRQLYKLLIARR